MRKIYCALGAILATCLIIGSITANAGRGGFSSGGRSYSSSSSFSSSRSSGYSSSPSYARPSSPAPSYNRAAPTNPPSSTYKSSATYSRPGSGTGTASQPAKRGVYSSATPTYSTPAPAYNQSYQRYPSMLGRNTVVEHHYYGGGGYYGGYGGSVFHNPFFWMWALDSRPTYYAPGAYVPGYGTVGPQGATLAMPVAIPLWESVALWFLAFATVVFFIWLLARLWDWSEDY